MAHKRIRTPLRDFLRDNGVCVGGTKYISHQLFDVLQEDRYKEWPEEEIARQIKTGRDFNSYQNPAFRAKMESKYLIPQAKKFSPQQHTERQYAERQPPQTQTPQEQPSAPPMPGSTTMPMPGPATMPIPRPETPHRPTPRFAPYQQPTQDLPTKALTDLTKLYSDEALKFSGDKYDILDAKLKVFHEMYCKADIYPHHYHEAFSIMLKGRAHQFYYDHLAERNLNFDDMVHRTKVFFHTTENH